MTQQISPYFRGYLDAAESGARRTRDGLLRNKPGRPEDCKIGSSAGLAWMSGVADRADDCSIPCKVSRSDPPELI